MTPFIKVDIIKPEEQRYKTVGDWYFKGETLEVKVSVGDFQYATLLAIHEIIEASLCAARGITSRTVDRWDVDHVDHPEPGSIPGCPYYREHLIATIIERMLADEMDVDWDKYEEVLEKALSKR